MSKNHGKVWWTELMTRDVSAARAYYTKVCGWEFSTMPMGEGMGDYNLGMLGGVPVAGVMDLADMGPEASDIAPYWMSYFAVDDLEQAIADTRAAGGAVLRDIFEVPGTGRIAILKDPTGAELGLMTPEPMDEG